jgi:hypothetical protein
MWVQTGREMTDNCISIRIRQADEVKGGEGDLVVQKRRVGYGNDLDSGIEGLNPISGCFHTLKREG